MFDIPGVMREGMKIINKFIPDPAEKIKAEQALFGGLMKADEAQIGVNKIEAGHRSIFVAGWRPFIGWNCGIALSMHFVILPLVNVAAIYLDFTPPVIAFDMETLMTVLLGMLGLGGMRTYEKIKGIAK
jgi:hypothetical protein|tara:strand:- start:1372 stop:1758 length:387 start_codon:yes stop_codon:yes gene_type:complete